MIELGILIAIIVGLWAFSSSISSAAIASEQATKNWSEEVIKDAVLERQQIAADFDKDLAKFKQDNPDFEVISHEDLLKKFKV